MWPSVSDPRPFGSVVRRSRAARPSARRAGAAVGPESSVPKPGSDTGPACARAIAEPRASSDQDRTARTSTRACHPSSVQRSRSAPMAAVTRAAAAQATCSPSTGSPAAASAARSAAAWARCRATTAPPRSSRKAVRVSTTTTAEAAHTVADPRSPSPPRPPRLRPRPVRRGPSGRRRADLRPDRCLPARGVLLWSRPSSVESADPAKRHRRHRTLPSTAPAAAGAPSGSARGSGSGSGGVSFAEPPPPGEAPSAVAPGSRRARADPLTRIGSRGTGAARTVTRISSPTESTAISAPGGATPAATPRARSRSPRAASRASSRAAS